MAQQQRKVIISPQQLNYVYGNDPRYWIKPENGPVKAVQVLLLSVSGSVPAEKGKYSVKFTVSLKDDAFGWDGTPLLVAAKVGKTGKFTYQEVNLSYVSSLQTIPSESGDGLTIDVNEDKAEDIHFGLYELSKKKWKGGLEIHSAIVEKIQ